MIRYPFVLLCLFSVVSLLAQAPAPAPPPAVADDVTVGLVLSGGGAKGYAHIGALRVLEEAGVRVDYIGGTSMGSIVGGLYAAGYSADQLEELLRSIDIFDYLQDAIEREDRPIYEKMYDEKYLLGLDLRNFSVQLPAALSEGQRVHDLFSHWTAPVGHITDLSQLPIPFLAVATDLGTGEDVVLDRGHLADVMRASAALPGLLSPYELDGRVLTDGGVSNNYPAEEVRNRGVDYVLGISVESDALKGDEIKSVDQLLLQIAFFQANRRNLAQYEVTDLDVKPDLTGFSVVSFGDIDTLIAAGERAARAMLPELRQLAARQRPPGKGRDTSRAPVPRDINIAELKISGNTDLSDRQVISYLGQDLPGRVSWEDFRAGIVSLYATERYSHIDYYWEPLDNGTDGVRMEMTLTEAPEFGQRLRLGLHYDQVYRSNLLLNLTLNDLVTDNTITSIDVIGGSQFRFNADFRVRRINGMAFGLRARRHYADVAFELDQPMAAPRGLVFDRVDFRFSDLRAEAYWDVRQTSNSITGLASELKWYTNRSDQLASADSTDLFRLSGDLYLVPKAYFYYDKLDQAQFPLRGFRIDAKARAVRNLTRDNQREDGRWALNADLDVLGLLQIGRRTALGLELSAGGFLNRSSLPFRYYLGSNNRNLMNNFKPFAGLDIGEASGTELLLGDLFLRTGTFAGHFLDLGARLAYLGNPEGLPSSTDRPRHWNVHAGYGIDSPLGPIELTYAHSDRGGELYFNLGYWF